MYEHFWVEYFQIEFSNIFKSIVFLVKYFPVRISIEYFSVECWNIFGWIFRSNVSGRIIWLIILGSIIFSLNISVENFCIRYIFDRIFPVQYFLFEYFCQVECFLPNIFSILFFDFSQMYLEMFVSDIYLIDYFSGRVFFRSNESNMD